METKAKIITVAGKGGVGKTSICACIVRLLVEKYPDKKILAIDADPAVGLSVAQLDLPVLRPLVVLAEGFGCVLQSLPQDFDLLFLRLDLFVEDLVAGGQRLYGMVVFVELGGHQLHFRAEDLKGGVDIRKRLLEFLFALKTDLQTEIVSHGYRLLPLDPVRDDIVYEPLPFGLCQAVILPVAFP